MTTMTAVKTNPLRAWNYFTLNAYWFALSFLWNSMGPILLPTMVPLLVPESQKGTALGTLSAIGLIIATIVQPAAGAWSDAHTTRWGKRRPYIVGGISFASLFLVVMLFAQDYVTLLLAYVLLQFSSNVAHGPYQSYIPELVPEHKRGKVTGVKQLFEMVGLIITSLVVGNWVGAGQMGLAFAAIIFFLLFTMVLTAVFVTEQPYEGAVPMPKPATRHASFWQTIFFSRDFFLWLVSRLLILLGANLVRNYVLLFLKDVLKLPNPAAEAGSLLAIIGVAVAVVAYPAGALSDRFGRKGMVIASGVLGAIGAVMLLPATTMTTVLIAGGVIGLSIGIFLSANWAWATDLIPGEESGRFLGISNIATAGSGVLAGVGGVILDFFNNQVPGSGYTVLYALAAGCFLLGAGIAFAVQDTRSKQ
jgi:Na+/melibiose symporter-like transporter